MIRRLRRFSQRTNEERAAGDRSGRVSLCANLRNLRIVWLKCGAMRTVFCERLLGVRAPRAAETLFQAGPGLVEGSLADAPPLFVENGPVDTAEVQMVGIVDGGRNANGILPASIPSENGRQGSREKLGVRSAVAASQRSGKNFQKAAGNQSDFRRGSIIVDPKPCPGENLPHAAERPLGVRLFIGLGRCPGRGALPGVSSPLRHFCPQAARRFPSGFFSYFCEVGVRGRKGKPRLSRVAGTEDVQRPTGTKKPDFIFSFVTRVFRRNDYPIVAEIAGQFMILFETLQQSIDTFSQTWRRVVGSRVFSAGPRRLQGRGRERAGPLPRWSRAIGRCRRRCRIGLHLRFGPVVFAGSVVADRTVPALRCEVGAIGRPRRLHCGGRIPQKGCARDNRTNRGKSTRDRPADPRRRPRRRCCGMSGRTRRGHGGGQRLDLGQGKPLRHALAPTDGIGVQPARPPRLDKLLGAVRTRGPVAFAANIPRGGLRAHEKSSERLELPKR